MNNNKNKKFDKDEDITVRESDLTFEKRMDRLARNEKREKELTRGSAKNWKRFLEM